MSIIKQPRHLTMYTPNPNSIWCYQQIIAYLVHLQRLEVEVCCWINSLQNKKHSDLSQQLNTLNKSCSQW